MVTNIRLRALTFNDTQRIERSGFSALVPCAPTVYLLRYPGWTMATETPRILIVDDDPNLGLALELMFAQHDYQVEIVRTGERVIDRIPVFRPHLVLMEVRLPFRSGFEVCQIIRSHPEWHPIRVVLLTVKNRQSEMAKGLALGADAYITKPFATADLLRTVSDLLKERP
jgi:DNA-binding response OmpR family regulator